MKRIKKAQLLVSGIIFLLYSCAPAKKVEYYKPTWESVAEYNICPEWFKDAKFGIFAHWGVLSVPAFANDWYARNMHIPGTVEFKHHVETYGPHSKFGYHDFVPLFKAEYFIADQWAEIFSKSGAKFSGIVAEHHDGWSNWGSKINPWNSVDMGPHRDIMGELSKSIRKRGMKFVATFHKDRNLQLFKDNPDNWLNDSSYFPYNPGLPTSSTDPMLSIMYGNIPKEQFYKNWLGELKEIVDNYSPDLIYFDGQMVKIPEQFKLEFLSYAYNRSKARDQQIVITNKEDDLPSTASVMALEKGRMGNITPYTWLTDETISVWSWSYTDMLKIRPADEILDILADVVSKNGVLLLNISPKADGTIPKDQIKVTEEIGKWLEINGESIFATRPWDIYGEGPVKQQKSGSFLTKILFTEKDIRYTKKDKTIYAIILGWPGDNHYITLKSFSTRILGEKTPKIKSVSFLGYNSKSEFNLDVLGLHVKTPGTSLYGQQNSVIKIETD